MICVWYFGVRMPSSEILTDCQYNIAKQLEKKLEFLWHVDDYIKDAE
jgi:hypothetical protein